MKTRWQTAVAIAALALGSTSLLVARTSTFAAGEQPAADPAAAVEQVWTRWFVELNSPPTADGTSLATVRAEKAAFRAAAAQAGLQYRELYAYDTLWNGLSIEIDPAHLARLWRIEGVRNLYPVAEVAAPDPPVEDGPQLATALAMTGADVAQTTLGYTGAGVKVGVIDSGIDYHHPDLGGCFGDGCRVAVGWDFVGDAFTGPASTPVPDPDPDDCGGHGTHVAGIIGANGGVTGVAPDVTFGAYRVFGCSGSTTADIIIAALERVYADGMDVVNMSLGAAFQWPQYPTAQASDRLVNRGISVVASIGNSGASGVYSGGAPGVGHKVIGVASFNNTHVALPFFTISPDGTQIGYSAAAGAPLPPTAGTFPMARTGTATSTADACDPLPAGSLTGRVALIRRGGCTFHQKSLNAQNAGAIGVVLYNHLAGRISPTVAGSPAITIPVVAISDTEGVLIDSRLAAGPVDLTWTDQTASFPGAAGAGLISSFSSYGLSPDLAVKPDIGAPGGSIRSTYPLERGGYATASGTSMSSPHVAGGVALLLQARPHTPSNAVNTILQNSAVPRLWWGNPASGFLDNVHRQGAGMLNIPGAILAETRIEPGKLSLGESEAGPATRTLTIENSSGVDRTYTLSHVPALSTGGSTFVPSFFTSFATVAFSESSVTVPAGGSATVDVTVTANPALGDRSQYGGYVVFTPDDGGPVYRVPYAGFKGDYQSILVLNPAASSFGNPLLRPSLSLGPSEPITFNPDAGEAAWIRVHLDHQVRRLRMEVFDAVTGRAWFRAFEAEYVGRNSTATLFFAIPWDGVTMNGRRVNVLANGDYVIHLSVQKALGDDDNPAHWETWISPVITIARPVIGKRACPVLGQALSLSSSPWPASRGELPR